jgi:hypothetical protein
MDSDIDYRNEDQDGWISWAWSYVPQILPTEDDYEFEDEAAMRARKNEPSVLVVGFCINKGSLTFKVMVLLFEMQTLLLSYLIGEYSPLVG